MSTKAAQLLKELNASYTALHQDFEEAFWIFQMGDHSYENKMNDAEKKRDMFRADSKILEKVRAVLAEDLSAEERDKLQTWENFFKLYQTPPELVPLRDKIAELESKISRHLANRKEGYIDPETGEFIQASKLKMRMIIRTHPDERFRKACFEALEELNAQLVNEYIEIVELRNRYARAVGFEDYYAYHLHLSEGMMKKEVFDIFGKIYEGTRDTFLKMKELEKSRPGLRKPWNYSYMMSGSFTHEEDRYYNFDDALLRWGRSFSALGIDFRGGTLQLDLLDRPGKYNNGFCHYPRVVNFNSGKFEPGAANFTCNVVYGQVGSGFQGMHTLFHEGGHAADRLNSEQTETCLNTEWPPASIAWAETHSQFLDTMFASIEWRTRYARDAEGNPYPFDLFERKARQLRIAAPHSLHHIMFVSEFEKLIYEDKALTPGKVLETAREMYRKYFDMDGDSLSVLSVPHIYSWDSSAYYHAYGLAILALEQWRKYFYGKYGYIVDNPDVGKEMTEVWKLASAKNFAEFVKLATGAPLSPEAFLEDVTMDIDQYISRAKERIRLLESVPEYKESINLNADIRMVNGKETVADNSGSFEDMAHKYVAWLHSQVRHS